MAKKMAVLAFGLILFVALTQTALAQEMRMPGMSAPAQAQPQPADISSQLKQLQSRLNQLQKELESIRAVLGFGPGAMAP